MSETELQIIMPVHNEAASVEQTLLEWYEELSPRIAMQFVISEDGSRDGTKEILERLNRKLPMILFMSKERLGYGGAVIKALRSTTAPFVLAVDSDGQCKPEDLWQFWEQRRQGAVAIGWRVNRHDTRMRKIMSGAFGLLHRTLFPIGIHDPSCPYLLIPRDVLECLLPELGLLTEGFWWEFTARCVRSGFGLVERPIDHRRRTAGETVVFRPAVIPRIALQNGLGLMKVWLQTRSRKVDSASGTG